MYNEMSLN